ncbi:beta-d-glucosyl crocetin beta-1 6-glucosyltransferase [Phtheirospermum japonicum]|uniref:Beta-d-glucosyl crocetin beta-1 6-glucosyltransferase n=1 Tax=Phtheirospermum japonicum TaxID=374723 RepID=A0A830D4L0_9LAMI|nr:beta-d-glucosyl crocetin beta-1 6-glucosyltransferase [Phtheirospermum japonicum]
MDPQTDTFKILMFPWLAHGHIFPFLELAKKTLSRKRFHIYFCSTAINFPSINSFVEKTSLASSIDLVQLHLQPSIELPPHYHTTKNLPSKLNLTLLKSFQTAKSSFSNIIDTIKPDLVIYDIFQPWAAKISSSRNIPAVHFAAFGAATSAFVHHHYVSRGDDCNFPFSTALCLKDQDRKTIDDLIEFLCANVFDGDRDVLFANYKLSTDAIVLLKTCRGFEGKYIDYVSDACGVKIVPAGPLVTGVCENAEESSEYVMKWLSKKNTCSTVYISFGSEYFLCKEEIDEIAKGLELCDVNFIWVIRFPVEEKDVSVEEALPEGFLDRVRDRGIVVSEWAPQANILAHRNTGAFISHCGWSSITESVYFGVPVIGMPMKLNMFIDAKMLVDVGACVEVKREGNGVYKGDEIANAINKVIVGKTGEGIRRKARELSEKMRTEEERALDETAEELWRICLQNKK